MGALKSMRTVILLTLCLGCFSSGGCRKKRVETPAVPVPPAPLVPSAVAPAASPAPVPGLPASAQPKIGEAMPPVTTEMMLKFEARFGRPPTNYTELSRLKN